jgi:glucosylceramidase
MKSIFFKAFLCLPFSIFIFLLSSCQKNRAAVSNGRSPLSISARPLPPPPSGNSDVALWLTKGDGSVLLQKQVVSLVFGTTTNRYSNIVVDSAQRFQSIDGFGYTLTGGSCEVINGLDAATKTSLLNELFGKDSSSIGVSYLRVSIGASDLSSSVYSYDDMPAGQTDPTLQNFSLAPDQAQVISLLKQILAINPAIKILSTPWSPPAWMKDNAGTVGGSLLPAYYGTYANYLVKYLQGMKAQGITVDALTPQNEPLNPNNNPSMYMTAAQERDFIKNNLGPALQAAGLATKIILYDHNCDHPEYPVSILDDAAARGYVNGSAFHLYAGAITALSTVHDAYPAKDLYFTEQYTASTGNFGGDLKWHLKNVVIGATRNWSRNVLEWNLANNASYGPHTPGGCTTCKGALTIGTGITRNVAYYIIAHASRFVPAGSVRIGSAIVGSLQNVAFQRPDGKKVLIVENDGASSQTFNIQYGGKWVTTTLDGGAVGSYVW